MKTFKQFISEGDIDRGRHALGLGRKKNVYDFHLQRHKRRNHYAKPSENTNQSAPEFKAPSSTMRKLRPFEPRDPRAPMDV